MILQGERCGSLTQGTSVLHRLKPKKEKDIPTNGPKMPNQAIHINKLLEMATQVTHDQHTLEQINGLLRMNLAVRSVPASDTARYNTSCAFSARHV